jgi:hypothetical protein
VQFVTLWLSLLNAMHVRLSLFDHRASACTGRAANAPEDNTRKGWMLAGESLPMSLESPWGLVIDLLVRCTACAYERAAKGCGNG